MGKRVFYLARRSDGYRYNDTKVWAANAAKALETYRKLGQSLEGLMIVPAIRS